MPTPTNAELLAAVRAFLETEALPELKGRTAYHAKVAAAVLAIVERAMAQGEPPPLPADLSDAIRSGEVDATTPGLLGQLRAATLAQLAIDNPKYTTYLRLLVKSD
jgi:Domain of unknown function (DUF6285)